MVESSGYAHAESSRAAPTSRGHEFLKSRVQAVSSHISLILLPVVLDLFLWLGPRLSVYGLVSPFLKLMLEEAQQTLTSAAEIRRFAEFQSLFGEIIERFNLFSLAGRLQLFPVGVSSLVAQTMPVETPLGSQPVVQISSIPTLVGLGFLLVVTGWSLGGLYFRWVSGTTWKRRVEQISFGRAIVQTWSFRSSG
jgi:hypothetical protein